MDQQRNISLDILRICACIGVVVIHASGTPDYHNWVSGGTITWDICAIMEAVSRWSVPIFAMLSGFLFINPKKDIPLSKLYGKYIARIITALVFWSTFYAFTLHQAYYPFGIQEDHFWYLGMCIGLYMAVPIMRYIALNKSMLYYFCWVWFACKLYFFIGNYISLPFAISHLIFVDYVGYSMWGYYTSTIVLTHKHEYSLYALSFIGLFANIVGYIVTQDLNCCYASYTSITNIAISFGLFYLCTHHSFNGSERLNKVIQSIAECTLGIYLIHLWMLIQIIFRVHRFIPSIVLTVVISTGLAFIGSLVVIFIIKRIPFLKKWVV